MRNWVQDLVGCFPVKSCRKAIAILLDPSEPSTIGASGSFALVSIEQILAGENAKGQLDCWLILLGLCGGYTPVFPHIDRLTYPCTAGAYDHHAELAESKQSGKSFAYH